MGRTMEFTSQKTTRRSGGDAFLGTDLSSLWEGFADDVAEMVGGAHLAVH